MHKSKQSLVILIHTLLDVCIVILSFSGAYFVLKYLLKAPSGFDLSTNYYIVFLLLIITMYIVFNFFDLYSSFPFKNYPQILMDLIKAASIGMIILTSMLFILKTHNISRIFLAVFYINFIFLLSLSKGIILIIYLSSEKNRNNIKNILIVGSQQRAKQVIDLIEASRENINIVGCLDVDSTKVCKEVKNGICVIGTMENLKDIVLRGVVDEVIFAMALGKITGVDKYMLFIEEIGIRVRIIPEWHIHSLLYKPKFAKIMFDDFLGTPTMIVSATSSLHGDLLIKKIIDYTVSGILCLLFAPFFIIIGILIKSFSPGTVFFKQERSGLNGRKFYLYKFRTMVPDAEKLLEKYRHLNEADGPAFKIEKDPRIIPFIGKILRKTSLDEFPQIINVLRGEMSLVGPRPPLPAEVEQYDVWQRRRLSMKPGLTCIWQIAPSRNDIGFKKWMEMDLEYIDKWSLKLDFTLLLKTVKVVIAGHGR